MWRISCSWPELVEVTTCDQCHINSMWLHFVKLNKHKLEANSSAHMTNELMLMNVDESDGRRKGQQGLPHTHTRVTTELLQY